MRFVVSDATCYQINRRTPTNPLFVFPKCCCCVSFPRTQDVLRQAFEKATIRRMMSDVPWGVLLSGGLDSSLVASICARHIKRRSTSFPKLHSFTIGLPNSPDIQAAQQVADFLGTVHHAYTYTLEEGADAIRSVIQAVETYDVTTTRASTPMYLMSRKIKAMGIKMVLSGEGADEVFGGYLYFHKCPNTREMFEETRDKLSRLHMYDCLRCNKSMSAWGVEPRVPFLDADFLEVAMNMDPQEKMIIKGPGVAPKDTRIEKWAMRKAFDTPDDPYLPKEILWRQKEQFSDGVGYGWVDSLKDIAEREVSDQMFANAANWFQYNTPTTKEGYRYRMIFEELFPGEAAVQTVPGGKSIACSTERAMAWDASFASRADPSGRAAGVHDSAYDGGFVADTVVKDWEYKDKSNIVYRTNKLKQQRNCAYWKNKSWFCSGNVHILLHIYQIYIPFNGDARAKKRENIKAFLK